MLEKARAVLLLFLALAGSGCGGDDTDDGASAGGGGPPVPACTLGFLGDPAKPVEMKLIALGPNDVSKELEDGDPIAMILPPQGGRVVFVGARATNIGACGVQVRGSLKDPINGQVRVDARTTNLKPTGDGWGGAVDADISTFSNIPTCPNQWAATSVYGNTFELTVKLTDKEGRSASRTIHVVPYCAEPENEAECTCQCQKDYKLGQSCDP